jgi:hypothetical protein
MKHLKYKGLFGRAPLLLWLRLLWRSPTKQFAGGALFQGKPKELETFWPPKWL